MGNNKKSYNSNAIADIYEEIDGIFHEKRESFREALDSIAFGFLEQINNLLEHELSKISDKLYLSNVEDSTIKQFKRSQYLRKEDLDLITKMVLRISREILESFPEL